MSTRRCWESDVRLSKQALRDLQWWCALADKHLKRAIYREATTATLFIDASKSGWGGILNRRACVHGIWTKAQSAQHITYLELLGVFRSVAALLPRLKRRRCLLFVDNMAVVYIIRNFSSRAPLLMALLRDLCGMCENANTILECHWVPTDRNPADEPSRRSALDHWRLDPRVLANISARFQLGFTVDRFATAATTLLPRWNSPCPEEGSEAEDGLSTDWTTECNWVHPPLKLLAQVSTKLERAPAAGVVVTPFWPAEQWFRSLRALSSEVVVVTGAHQLECPRTRELYGLGVQGKWPLAFWRLAPGQATTCSPAQWLDASQLLV